ncbi:hypothetical protein ACNS7O_00565 [Haloferacaceae archaeon DSL9]
MAVSRRALFRASSSLAVAALAGCATGGGESEDATSTADSDTTSVDGNRAAEEPDEGNETEETEPAIELTAYEISEVAPAFADEEPAAPRSDPNTAKRAAFIDSEAAAERVLTFETVESEADRERGERFIADTNFDTSVLLVARTWGPTRCHVGKADSVGVDDDERAERLTARVTTVYDQALEIGFAPEVGETDAPDGEAELSIGLETEVQENETSAESDGGSDDANATDEASNGGEPDGEPFPRCVSEPVAPTVMVRISVAETRPTSATVTIVDHEDEAVDIDAERYDADG